jgi:hypothetical protein
MPHLHFYARVRKGRGGERVYETEDHEVVGARQAEQVLLELGMEGERIRHIVPLVLMHMDKGTETPDKALRLLARAGEAADDLLVVHAADRAAHGGEEDFRAAQRLLGIEREALRQARVIKDMPPAAVFELALRGGDVHAKLGLQGQAVGQMVAALTEEVRQGKLANEERVLLARARELAPTIRREVSKARASRRGAKTRRRR